MIHNFKIDRESFLAIVDGRRKFDFRPNDRIYSIGDTIIHSDEINNTCESIITYIMYDSTLLSLSGFIIISIELK
jgi:hypothetical protein